MSLPKGGPCPGPLYLGDQGIEECETCLECSCCSPRDHTDALRRCFVDAAGRCVLVAHAGLPCKEGVREPGDAP